MGSFWGLDQAGREAQGWPREWGAYSSAQAKNWIPRSDQAYSSGEGASQWYQDWNRARANDGLGSIATARDYGGQIMPGVNDYIGNRSARLQDQIAAYDKLPSWQDTADKIDRANSDSLSYIDQTRNSNLGDIGDQYHRSVGNENDANAAITGDLTSRYNSLIDKTNADYGGLRGTSDDAYKSAFTNAELLRPGGQFATAQMARSFAPQIASTAGALRRSGVDPNSPQGLSAMQRVLTGRSRAMDDAAASGTFRYVDAKNNLLERQQADREGLGERQNSITTGLSVDQGTGLRGEHVRHSGTLNTLDSARGYDTRGQQNATLGLIDQNERQQQQAALTRKTLATQDWQTRGEAQAQLSDAELQAIGLRQQEYNAGMGFHSGDLAEKNAGAGGVGQYGAQQTDLAYRDSGLANNWGQTAMDAYKTAYGYEAPQAGWGAKLIGSMVGPALAAIPGVGPVASQAMSMVGQGANAVGQAQGAYGATPGGGGGGGFQTPGFAQSAAPSWQGTMTNLMDAYATRPQNAMNTQSIYDPSKTRTNADGSLTVGRY